jgi:hypothetical protein
MATRERENAGGTHVRVGDVDVGLVKVNAAYQRAAKSAILDLDVTSHLCCAAAVM